MTRISSSYCAACGEQKTFVNGKCGACKKKKAEEEERRWSALSVDDRLLDLHRRMKALESGPTRY